MNEIKAKCIYPYKSKHGRIVSGKEYILRQVSYYSANRNMFAVFDDGKFIGNYNGRFFEIRKTNAKPIYPNTVISMLDDIEDVRQKANERPENYSVDYVIRLISAIIAEYAGYECRCDWTDELRNNPETKYATRIKNGEFHI